MPLLSSSYAVCSRMLAHASSRCHLTSDFTLAWSNADISYSGDQFYTPLALSYDNRWRDLGIFAAFIASNLLLLFIGSRYISYNRR